MDIATMLDYGGGWRESAERLRDLERAGLDHVWVAEAWGFDSPSLMGYLAALTDRVGIGSAILPIYSRTPALIAMTAAGIDALSDGRFHLGLGASGPQVIEGWHGVPFDSPVSRTREIIAICRRIWSRDEPVVHDGRRYRLPLPPDEGTGLGKPLKMITHPVRDRIPVWVASLGERNVAMTAEVADGWLPALFVAERAREVWGDALDEGLAARDPSLGSLQIAAGGPLAITDDEADARTVRDAFRPAVALYVGGMGSRDANFYNDLVRRYGYEEAAEEIQELYLDGRKDEAAVRVPDTLLEGLTLCGPEGLVAERIAAYREAGVTQLRVLPHPTGGRTAAGLIARVKELAA